MVFHSHSVTTISEVAISLLASMLNARYLTAVSSLNTYLVRTIDTDSKIRNVNCQFNEFSGSSGPILLTCITVLS